MQKILRSTALVLVIGFLGALIVFNMANPSQPNFEAWNVAMTLGEKEGAKHHFIMYTDIFCPYCDKFSNAVTANQKEFNEKYLEKEKVYFELRVTEMNYTSGHSENSRPAGEGAYCAAKQGKFWEYYHELLAKIYEDYHSKGIGVDQAAEKIPTLAMNYFFEAGEAAGLDNESFQSCVNEHDTLEELSANTVKAQKTLPSGVPYFSFGGYKTTGFLGNWDTDKDFEQVKTMLDAGLASKS